MKKIIIGLVAAVGGVLAVLKLKGSRSEQKLWAEATDTVPASPETPPPPPSEI